MKMKLTKDKLKEIIRDELSEAWPKPQPKPEEGPKQAKTDIMDNPFDKEEDGEKGSVKEGPAYEYAKYIKNIEKSQKLMDRTVRDLQKALRKAGHTSHAGRLMYFYEMLVAGGKKSFDVLIRKIYDELS